MARKVTEEDKILMNELYLKLKTYAAVARETGFSPTTVKRYIIQKKINYACELLLLGRYSINQIAELCNFSDVYYFSKQFKEQMGVSPTEYIKKHKS